MESIPLVNIMAIVHLCFVAAFVGTVMTENLMELNVFFRKQNGSGVLQGFERLIKLFAKPHNFHSEVSGEDVKEIHNTNIRNHFWIDVMVELPLVIGVVASGVTMAILVDRLSMLHITKIAIASCAMIGLGFCVKRVVRRNRMLEENLAEDSIIRESWKMYVTALIIEPLLIPILFLGFWLGYHRILESIY